jgi:hypothetical protein
MRRGGAGRENRHEGGVRKITFGEIILRRGVNHGGR